MSFRSSFHQSLFKWCKKPPKKTRDGATNVGKQTHDFSSNVKGRHFLPSQRPPLWQREQATASLLRKKRRGETPPLWPSLDAPTHPPPFRTPDYENE